MRSFVLLLLFVAAAVDAFECPSDTILRLATNHREKDIEAECHRQKTNIECASQEKADQLWKEFEGIEKEYKKIVAECVKNRRGYKVRRNVEDDPTDPNIDHTGHNHRTRRHDDHDPNDPNIDHSGHNHRKRRQEEHDPNDPEIDHTGHNHRRRRHDENHDPQDPNIDHTGHNHRRKRNGEIEEDDLLEIENNSSRRRRHDYIDGHIHIDLGGGHRHDHHHHEDYHHHDHHGQHHRMRRQEEHDPNDPNIDHSGHQHRRRRHDGGEHDPNDPNIDHTGHNHKRRDLDAVFERAPFSEPERQQTAAASRARRQVCKTKSSDELKKLAGEYKEHCDRENICLPDEDLPAGPQRNKMKELQEQRAKKYSQYLTEVAKCKI